MPDAGDIRAWSERRGGQVETNTNEVLGTFHGDENFTVDWKEGERDLFWILDDPSAYAEASEYGSRYVPRVPEGSEYAGKIGAYMGSVLPHYAYNFLDWWRERLRPEMDRNFAYLDGQDKDGMNLIELAVLLEDAIDIHDRHWKIHWMLNFAQFSATTALN